MAKIFYSMAGEGRGHAARVRTLVEQLQDEHELHLFAPEEAYDFLERFYGPDSPHSSVRLVRIPGLRFEYTGGKLNLLGSIWRGLKYAAWELPRLVRAFRRRIQAERPDLVICDFEPSLPRAAHRERIPFLSIDHQHVLVACDLSSLSMELQWYAWWMGWAIRWHYAGRCHGVMTAFYQPPVKPGFERLQLVGPIIRPEVVAAKPTNGDYLLSYLRAATPERVFDVLARSPLPVKIYGLGSREPRGNATFHPIHEHHFIEDLAGCRAVVCAAGNQLLGEALFLGKPVLAIPEEIHHEQRINAHFLRDMGAGDWTTLEAFDEAKLAEFLAGLDGYQSEAAKLCGRLDGTAQALEAIQHELKIHFGSLRTKVAA
jgi:uncharacterized protein (TIGR00661 family)